MTVHTVDAETLIVCWNSSLTRADGGGQRANAFIDIIADISPSTLVVPVGPGGDDMGKVTHGSIVHRLKRHLLPVPLRLPIERELSDRGGATRVVSLVSGSHAWSIKNSDQCWIDFPDRWSEYARTAAVGAGLVSKTSAHAQARLWENRERTETKSASLVTTASYDDKLALGQRAIWLPNPIKKGEQPRTPKKAPKGPLTFGLLANFDYPPNRKAYETLCSVWLDKLLQYSGTVVVAGFGSESLAPVPGVENLGVLESIADFYSNVDVALAPITTGGGMKVKVVEALYMGLPVITTPHAREGLPPSLAGRCVDWSDFSSDNSERSLYSGGDEELEGDLRRFSYEHFEDELKRLWSEL